ncbi:hypothetical protein RE628_17545 [Paenibacillus sp. D2_2]|uniref:hypothetical protein n=1 Tax=Paenibacillus sp. D2_2 TaxID=3073092 RepID=UPI002815C7FD|nr:hypothetical protein [Paenibacillus sp. D2_2]WMT39256.1 hypothetical protein RE628_17545 [Paenibacillus sp. D2_2]
MESIAYGIVVAGIANAIALSLGYCLKYRMSKAKQKIYLCVTQKIVSENSGKIIEAVESSIKQQVIERMERVNV